METYDIWAEVVSIKLLLLYLIMQMKLSGDLNNTLLPENKCNFF